MTEGPVLEVHAPWGLVASFRPGDPLKEEGAAVVREMEQVSFRLRGAPQVPGLALHLGDDHDHEPVRTAQGDLVWDLQQWFLDCYGMARVQVRPRAADQEPGAPVVEGLLRVYPEKLTLETYRALLSAVSRAHQHLALDVLSKTRVGVRFAGGGPQEESHVAQFARIRELLRALLPALDRISRQPSRGLAVRREPRRFRPGAALDAGALRWLAARPDALTGLRAGRAAPVLPLRLKETTLDIPEHRMLKGFLLWLRERLVYLRGRAAAQIDWLVSQKSWRDRPPPGMASIWRQEDEPRIRELRRVSAEARSLERQLTALVEDHDFLAEARAGSSAPAPTQIFLNRPSYRAAYTTISGFLGRGRLVLDEGTVPMRLKSSAQLYEYYVFLSLLDALRRRAAPLDEPRLVRRTRDVFALDLAEGAEFRFAGRDVEIALGYEKRFPGRAAADERGLLLGRDEPHGRELVPDVTLELRRPGAAAPFFGAVFDAKFTRRIGEARWSSLTDYPALIFELATGRQPFRQVWLVHPGADARPWCSLRSYLSGRVVPPLDTFLHGRIPLQPRESAAGEPPPTAALEQVLDRILAHARERRP
jgi:hypothetical protein